MHSLAYLRRSAEAALRRGCVHAIARLRDYSPKGRAIAAKRATTDELINEVARSAPYRFDGAVLVDAMWDNPNYWFRFSLFRAAIGLVHGREVGLLGEFRQQQCRGTLERLGIKTVESFLDIPVGDVAKQADALIAKTRSAECILQWQLPGNVHPAIVYDGILKRQRLTTVDVSDPLFRGHVIAALACIERGRRILDRYPFDLVVISHPLNFTYGALAWQALARNIPVILPFGIFGGLRFTRFAQPSDLFRYFDRPTRTDIDALPPQKATDLATIGREYLARRLDGMAGDLPSQYAFQRNQEWIDREELCRGFGWDVRKPIVAIYAANWYDWPHQVGMTQFRDFLDWTQASFEAARANDRVNWLFKPHPAEEWFGGVALKDIFSQFGKAPNIALAERNWNNTHVMRSIDALVTYHGTAGIEFAALGKPVLVPDRGKYDDCGFVKVASSRARYLELLAGEWWRDINLEEARRRAQIFAGWWFCMPDWQGSFLLAEDAEQDALYDLIPRLIQENRDVIGREIQELHGWWQCGHPYYHTWKMANAQAFRLSNISAPTEAPARKVA